MSPSGAPEGIYFRQLLAGRHVALHHPAAGQMRNFMYLLGDPQSRKALVVDPAWDVRSLLDEAHRDGYEVVGALVTHYHPDHVGGDLWGLQVEGIPSSSSSAACRSTCSAPRAMESRWSRGSPRAT